jgi:hypothetical protein
MTQQNDDAALRALAQRFGEQGLADAAIGAGKSLADFKDMLLDRLAEQNSLPQWPLKARLSHPCEVFGESYAELSLREPTAADLVKFGVFDDAVSGDQCLDLIAHLAGLTPKDVRAFPGTDMLRLSKRLLGFLL